MTGKFAKRQKQRNANNPNIAHPFRSLGFEVDTEQGAHNHLLPTPRQDFRCGHPSGTGLDKWRSKCETLTSRLACGWNLDRERRVGFRHQHDMAMQDAFAGVCMAGEPKLYDVVLKTED